MTRVARLENTKARVAPILYMEGACGVRLKADENVAQIFKMDEPLFRSAISVFMKPLMRYIKRGIFLMMNNYAKKALRLFATLARQ